MSNSLGNKDAGNSQSRQSPPTQQIQAFNQTHNNNIKRLEHLSKERYNFNEIYDIFQKIVRENDYNAMNFAIKEKFYAVKNLNDENIFDFSNNYYNPDIDLAHFIIECSSNINHHKISYLKPDFIRYVLKIPQCIISNKNTLLIEASHWGCHEIVKFLLTVPGIDVNAKDKYNLTALKWASDNGHHEVVKLLLTVPGIDVNAKPSEYNDTALMPRSRGSREVGYKKVIKLLLKFPGIDVNVKNNENETALIIFAKYGHYKIVKHLVAFPGIDVNAKDNNNFSALLWATQLDYLDIVKYLLTVPGIDVNARDNKNETPLIKAHDNYEIVECLLKQPGLDVNAKDNENWTALMHASYDGEYEVVKLLLNVPGIDVHAKDKDNNTALDLASNYEVIDLLFDSYSDSE